MTKFARIVAAGMLLAMSIGTATADNGRPNNGKPDNGKSDPLSVAPDRAVVDSGSEVFVTVAASDAAAQPLARASLVVYAPDGTILPMRRKRLNAAAAKFRVPLGRAPQAGAYTVFATVEGGTEAFGNVTTFEVAGD